ncbi:glycosyltransferase involved in cell wall biosynthesis [Salinibacter ruber]|uniref:glycosyltransferase family 4 protein n=1 Tax=Salinibacter ruber TaxID=146919 RepID=UPI002166D681|nr:glycosyltransferase family 4 protein [Salinibacter ruber]MCS4044857.1 glycosyltransferase involved in cell wall biosynthesis [Salinibacter ruber]
MNQHVLLLSHKFNVSGASTHMLNLGVGLQRQGWDVAVAARDLAPGTPLGKERFEEEGIEVYQVSFANFSSVSDAIESTLENRGAAFRELHSVAKTVRPSVFHCHSATLVPFAQAVGMWHRIPTVTTLNSPRIRPENAKTVRAVSGYFGSVVGHEVIANSSETKKQLVDQLGLPTGRVHRTAFAADSDRFRPPSDGERRTARQEFELDQEERVVSLIGLLDSRKGHDVLVRAASRLQDRGCEVTVLCAGSGGEGEKRRITDLAKERRIADRIHLLGHQDARQVIWASDATVLPSTKDGDSFGLVAVESMLCGVPVVRTPAGGASDQIVDGESGFIIPFGDDEVLADRLERLLKDESLREDMGERAEDRARRLFSKEQMAEETIDVYQSAMQRF